MTLTICGSLNELYIRIKNTDESVLATTVPWMENSTVAYATRLHDNLSRSAQFVL